MSTSASAIQLALWPVPRLIEPGDGSVVLPRQGVVLLEAPDAAALLPAVRGLRDALQAATGGAWPLVASEASTANDFVLALTQVPGAVANPEGYSIRVSPARIDAIAATAAGLCHALRTLRQMAASCGNVWPLCRIVDWPDFPNRGVMLDISRDKVPTMETLYRLVDLLADLKFNQLQLYTEHTFAYRQHPEVWADASPMTGEEILALDAYCRTRFIELVPNQNTFGHMRPWLTLERYRDLAEAPDGCNTRWGWFDQPFSLNPGDPRSLELVVSLLDELLPHFSSSQVNVGCDETVDLGEGRSREAVAQRGFGAVFLEYLLKVHREVKRRGRTMQFWGDIIMEHPELIDQLPRDAIALEWGYEANHPFEEHGARFAASGVPFYVCPGTSSWNSVAGRTQNAMANLRSAARSGLRHGAVGYLVTDWGDNGHWQPWAVSLLPLTYGAGLAWCGETNADADVIAGTDRFVFRCERGSLARIAYELGDVDRLLEMTIHNTAALFRILQSSPESVADQFAEAGSPSALRDRLLRTQAAIAETRERIGSCQCAVGDGDQTLAEFGWAAELLAHACRRGLWVLDGFERGEESRALEQEVEELLERYNDLWHARNRPGGYADSAGRFETLRDSYDLH